MEEPKQPADETQRVAALRSLDVLDSSPEERFDRYTRLAKRLFDVPIALVSLVDSDRQWFKSRQGLCATETPRDISFCGHAILDSQIFVVEDTTLDDRFKDNPLVVNDPSIRFYAGFPLPGPGGHRMGTLCIIDREPRTLTEDDLSALRDIGAMVAGELGSLQLATTDPLTGLSNRRGFEVLARQSLARSKRAGEPNSVIMIDMDGFKKINDELGHDVGDQALVEFSAILVDTLRDSDVVARLGGDEFCALLAGTGEEDAHSASARLREAVHRCNRESESPYTLAFSAGVAECVPDQTCVTKVLRHADERMYDLKKSKPKVRRAG